MINTGDAEPQRAGKAIPFRHVLAEHMDLESDGGR